jgi:hypothetical protein
VCLVVGDSLLVVDAAVQGDVDAEGQEAHAASLSHTLLAIDRQAVAELVADPIGLELLNAIRLYEGLS